MDAVAPPLTLSDPRVALRRMEVADAGALFRIIDRDRAHLDPYLPWPRHIQTESDEVAFLREMETAWEAYQAFSFCICPPGQPEVVGAIGAINLRWSHHSAELGYWLASHAVGNGYMTAAVELLGGALFELGINRIEICCEPDNTASAAVAERCQYVLEGRLRQHILHHDGQFRDKLVYARLRQSQRLIPPTV